MTDLNILVFPNGRIVLTDLKTVAEVQAFEFDRDNPDWGFYKWCERNGKPLPMGRHYGATVIEYGARPGSIWELVLKFDMQDADLSDDYEFIDMMAQARRDQEWLDRKADAEEAAVYGPLERPRKRHVGPYRGKSKAHNHHLPITHRAAA